MYVLAKFAYGWTLVAIQNNIVGHYNDKPINNSTYIIYMPHDLYVLCANTLLKKNSEYQSPYSNLYFNFDDNKAKNVAHILNCYIKTLSERKVVKANKTKTFIDEYQNKIDKYQNKINECMISYNKCADYVNKYCNIENETATLIAAYNNNDGYLFNEATDNNDYVIDNIDNINIDI